VAGLLGAAGAALTLATGAALGAVLIATLPLQAPATGPTPRTAGVVAVVRDRTLRVVTLASSLGQLGPGALPIVVAVLAARRHEPAATGWLKTTAAAAGAAMAGALAALPTAALFVLVGAVPIAAGAVGLATAREW
jgi:hypothetical protein